MITTENYFSRTRNLDWNAVPASLKKTHETLIPDASKDDWQAFINDDDIRRVVEKYFTYIAKYVPSQELPTAVKTPSPAAKSRTKPAADAGEQRARELTIAFLRPYVERGETVEQINKSYLGISNSSGSFQVKSNKIHVDRIGEEAVSYTFPLRSIYNEIKGSASKSASSKPVKSRSKAKNIEDLPEPAQVVHIPTATVFIKRYVALNGKVKTKDQVLSLLHGLQKAITEQRIRASHPSTREIEKMQTGLIELAQKMGPSIRIEIDEPYLSHYKQVARGEEVRTSVKLLKQFIQLNGKRPEKAKAKKLGAKLLQAFEEIPKEDAYRGELAAATIAITKYVKGETETLDIPAASLHGLGSVAMGGGIAGLGDVASGNVLSMLSSKDTRTVNSAALRRAFRGTANPSLCYDLACAMIRRKPVMQARATSTASSQMSDQGISGLDVVDWRLRNAKHDESGMMGLGSIDEVPTISTITKIPRSQPKSDAPGKAISAQDLAKMRFKTIGYHGRFKDVIGDPAIGFHMMVYGKPFQGKSSFVIELCKDLAALNKGRIAYLALEEGISASMQKKVIDRGAANVSGIDFIGSMLPSFGSYRFVVIDSVSDRSLKREALRELFLKDPDVCFICIFHATKDGTARGGLDFSHDMDIIIRIQNHEPFIEKNRFV